MTFSRKPDEPDEADDSRTVPPGPTDQGRDGGMATRENAPDVSDAPVPEPPD